MKNRKDLDLGEVFYISLVYHISDCLFRLLRCCHFICEDMTAKTSYLNNLCLVPRQPRNICNSWQPRSQQILGEADNLLRPSTPERIAKLLCAVLAYKDRRLSCVYIPQQL